MPTDFEDIAGLYRCATFGASHVNSAIDFLQPDYVYKVASPPTFDCPDPLFPGFFLHKNAAWSGGGVDPHTIDLRPNEIFIDGGLRPSQDPTKEGLSGETLEEYVARLGTPDYLVLSGGGTIGYESYFTSCSTQVNPDFPAFGIELDGEGVTFGSGERGFIEIGINTSGLHGQGALDVAVAKDVATYTGDPTNEASRALFTWEELAEAVLYFEDGYIANILTNVASGMSFGVVAYYLISPDAELMCVL